MHLLASSCTRYLLASTVYCVCERAQQLAMSRQLWRAPFRNSRILLCSAEPSLARVRLCLLVCCAATALPSPVRSGAGGRLHGRRRRTPARLLASQPASGTGPARVQQAPPCSLCARDGAARAAAREACGGGAYWWLCVLSASRQHGQTNFWRP